MPYKNADRVFETGDCAGVGDVFLAGVFSPLYKPFSDFLLNGDTTTILIESTVAGEAEVCDATYTATGNRLVRGALLWSSRPDNGRVPFIVGIKRVMMTESIARVVRLDPTGLATIPSLTVTTTALMPSPGPGDDSQKAATTEWVRDNTTTALTPYAPLASPLFTGDPRITTDPPLGDNDGSIPSTRWVKSQGYAPIDAPLFTGDARITTDPAAADDDNSIPSTRWVRARIGAIPAPDLSAYAPLASPLFTGDPRLTTDPAASDNDKSIPSTGWVRTAITTYAPAPDLSAYAPLASPLFTGDPRITTDPAAADNDGSIPSTRWTNAAIAAALSGGGASISVGTTPPASPAANALWWSSELGQMYIYYNDGNTTQWVPASPSMATIIPAVQQDGVLRLYNEQVVTTPVGLLDVTIPANAKRVELEWAINTTGGANGALGFAAMVGGTPNVSAIYSQYGAYVFQSGSPVNGAISYTSTGSIAISASTAVSAGCLKLRALGTSWYFNQELFNFAGSNQWLAGSGTFNLAGVTGFRLFNSGAAPTFIAGSSLRCFVVT
jgi:hypothetical protein